VAIVTEQPLAAVPVLSFRLDQQEYALPVDDVVEVAALVELTRVTGSAPEVLGVANRHGTVLPMLDLRQVLDTPDSPLDATTLFIVGRHDDQMLGLVVDEVQQVEFIPLASAHKSSTSGRHIRGIISYKQRMLQIIDLASLVNEYLPGSALNDWLKVDT
jgi:purine-binding chemotaxis protein CheW